MDLDEIAALMMSSETLPVRSASEMAMASSPMAGDRFSINVYNHISNTEVVIFYPDVADGWIFRCDVSTSASLRWEYNDTLAVVTRHAACDNAVIPRQRMCRNCEMKRTWRKQCSEKCDTFHLVALDDDATSVKAAMATVVKQERQLSEFAISRFSANLPMNAGVRRSVTVEWDASSARAFEIEKRFRLRLIKSGQAVAIQRSVTTADLLIDLAYPDLVPSRSSVDSNVIDDFAELVNVTSSPPSDAVVVTPSREMVIVSPRRDPTSPVVLATTVATTDLLTVTEAYSALIDKLSPGQSVWTLNDWHAVADNRNFSSTFVRLNWCKAFDRLLSRLACRCTWSQIVLHPSMNEFMQAARGLIHAHGSVALGVGLYRAPNVEAYDAFCSSVERPTGRILVNPVYVPSTVDPPGVRPVVVMYHPPAGLVEVSKTVPLGVFGI